MSEKIVLPKFLTTKAAGTAVDLALDLARNLTKTENHTNRLERNHAHIVILIPAMDISKEWPNQTLSPKVVLERSMGDRDKWDHDYQQIARCKALQLWHGRNTGLPYVRPQLLYSGDTHYWGGVKRHGIVVACSGYESYFDKMLSGIISDTYAAIAIHHYEHCEEKLSGHDFLG